jgi:hypothetical protein
MSCGLVVVYRRFGIAASIRVKEISWKKCMHIGRKSWTRSFQKTGLSRAMDFCSHCFTSIYSRFRMRGAMPPHSIMPLWLDTRVIFIKYEQFYYTKTESKLIQIMLMALLDTTHVYFST